MKHLLLTALFLLTPVAQAGDTCLGEWTVEEEEYCEGLMVYVGAIIADRNADRPKEDVLAEVPDAIATFNIPTQLAINYIDLIYLYEDPKSNRIIPPLMDGCINNFNVIMDALESEGREGN